VEGFFSTILTRGGQTGPEESHPRRTLGQPARIQAAVCTPKNRAGNTAMASTAPRDLRYPFLLAVEATSSRRAQQGAKECRSAGRSATSYARDWVGKTSPGFASSAGPRPPHPCPNQGCRPCQVSPHGHRTVALSPAAPSPEFASRMAPLASAFALCRRPGAPPPGLAPLAAKLLPLWSPNLLHRVSSVPPTPRRARFASLQCVRRSPELRRGEKFSPLVAHQKILTSASGRL
jgi:hypothetical protein